MIKATIPLFGTTVKLFIGDDEVARYVRESGSCEDPRDNEGQQYGSYMWLSEADVGNLAHECCHIADAMLDYTGVKDSRGEVRAYVVGWLVNTFWTKIGG